MLCLEATGGGADGLENPLTPLTGPRESATFLIARRAPVQDRGAPVYGCESPAAAAAYPG